MPLVREITVTGSRKFWDSSRASGTEVSFTVIPKEKEWEVAEAKIVALRLRLEIEKTLIADSKSRGIILEPSQLKSLEEYEVKIKEMESRNPNSLNWEEKKTQGDQA